MYFSLLKQRNKKNPKPNPNQKNPPTKHSVQKMTIKYCALIELSLQVKLPLHNHRQLGRFLMILLDLLGGRYTRGCMVWWCTEEHPLLI